MARPLGSKNIKSIQWERLGDYMTVSASKRMRKLMEEMDDKEFIDTYFKLVKYFKPQMLSSTVKQEGEINIAVVSEDEKLIDKV